MEVEFNELERNNEAISVKMKENLRLIGAHANAEKLLPKNTRLNILKILILRLIRVYSSVQLAFNRFVFKQLSLQYELNEYYREQCQNFKTNHYKSLYFPEVENKFYEYHQTVFRGRSDNVKQSQLVYKPYVNEVIDLSNKFSFLDCGFGKGEFLELLKEFGVNSIIGVDVNDVFVKNAKKLGFTVVKDDLVHYLENNKQSLCGISAFQVLEHLPFEKIYDFIYLSYLRLVDNGVVIVETPNTENVLVSSNTFYYDYTHQTKLPPEFLKSIFDFVGFRSVVTIFKSPLIEGKLSKTDKLFYGERDYAIIARK